MPRDVGMRIVGEKTLRDFEKEYEEEARRTVLEGLARPGTIRRQIVFFESGGVWWGLVGLG